MNYSICLKYVVGLIVVLVAGCAGPRQVSYATPEEATESLVKAVRADDRPTYRRILGLESDETISTGDPDVDRHNIEEFLRAYDEKHHLAADSDGAMTLYVGSADWPFPFPLVQDAGKWHFDSDRGMAEVTDRRVGRNELFAIQTCLAIVDAQREYLAQNPDGGSPPQYAEKFISDSGRRNGLYWPAPEGQIESPLGLLVAEAAQAGYELDRRQAGDPRPYHGYYWRMLKGQGSQAPGGAGDYSEGGRLTRGFAVVAYPADYGKSGITTFIVSHHGVVYQSDLGADTASKAKAMTVFDPGPIWTVAEMRGRD